MNLFIDEPAIMSSIMLFFITMSLYFIIKSARELMKITTDLLSELQTAVELYRRWKQSRGADDTSTEIQ